MAAIGIGALLILMAALMMLLCGRSSVCANPSSFAAMATLATTIVGAGGAVITGAYGHAQGGKSSSTIVSHETERTNTP